MDFQGRFIKLIEDKNVTPYYLSKESGVSQSTISRIINKGGVPNRSTIHSLSQVLKVNPDWLYSGVGDMQAGVEGSSVHVEVNSPFEVIYLENNNSNSFINLENGQYLMTMPLAEFNIQAGFLDHYQDVDFLNGLSKHSIIVDKPVKGRYVAFRVKGDSMDDGTSNAILQNSIVSTRELQRQHWTNRIRINDFQFWVIYTTQSRYPLLKEITEHDTERGVIKCHSLNDAPEYTDFELSLDEVQALFYVVDVNKQLSKKLIY